MNLKKIVDWILINYIIPITPFAVKGFVNYYGPNGDFKLKNLMSSSDILIYSFILCIITLNVNLNGPKKIVEIFFRWYLYMLIVADNILLAMLYTNQVTNHTSFFLKMCILVPLIGGVTYKIYNKTDNT
jgi:hypothetical protein